MPRPSQSPDPRHLPQAPISPPYRTSFREKRPECPPLQSRYSSNHIQPSGNQSSNQVILLHLTPDITRNKQTYGFHKLLGSSQRRKRQSKT